MNIIISLIGLSPVPNYVTLLNYCNENSKLYFIYSGSLEGSSSSLEIGKSIERVIKKKYKNISIEFLESSKSNFQEILKTIDNLKVKLNNLELKEPVDLILDITGSTKANSALFYSELSREFKNHLWINFKECYLDVATNNIFELSKQGKKYSIEDIKKDKGLKVQDILELYNYENQKELHCLEGVELYLDRINLLFYKKSTEDKIAKKKEEVFELFNMAEKLGGRFTKIVYEAEDFIDLSQKNCEDYMAHFLDKFTNEANSSYAKRLILKSVKENRYLRVNNDGRYLSDCDNIKKILGELN